MSNDLLSLITQVLTDHDLAVYSWGEEGCRCDNGPDEGQTQAEHQALLVTDLLIDLAAQGELLRAMDRIGR